MKANYWHRDSIPNNRTINKEKIQSAHQIVHATIRWNQKLNFAWDLRYDGLDSRMSENLHGSSLWLHRFTSSIWFLLFSFNHSLTTANKNTPKTSHSFSRVHTLQSIQWRKLVQMRNIAKSTLVARHWNGQSNSVRSAIRSSFILFAFLSFSFNWLF